MGRFDTETRKFQTRREEVLRFPRRLVPGASVGVPGSNSYRILVGVDGRSAGAAARLRHGRADLLWILRLSCHGFAANQVRLQLFALAYNLGNFLRRLALLRSIGHWSLRTLQTRLIKIGAKVVRHARYTCFQMAEVSITQDLFVAILSRIRRLLHPVPV